MSKVEIASMTLKDIEAVKKIEIKNNLSAWSKIDYANEIEKKSQLHWLQKQQMK